MRTRLASAVLLSFVLALSLHNSASAEARIAPYGVQGQSVELVLQGNKAFAYLYVSKLNDSDWTDISSNGGDTWNGPLGKVTNTWGGATGMTSEDVQVPSGQWVRACAWYAGGTHCTGWRQA